MISARLRPPPTRRISRDEHRLVYKVIDDQIRIAACRYHYER
jgi:toxin YoeB